MPSPKLLSLASGLLAIGCVSPERDDFAQSSFATSNGSAEPRMSWEEWQRTYPRNNDQAPWNDPELRAQRTEAEDDLVNLAAGLASFFGRD